MTELVDDGTERLQAAVRSQVEDVATLASAAQAGKEEEGAPLEAIHSGVAQESRALAQNVAVLGQTHDDLDRHVTSVSGALRPVRCEVRKLKREGEAQDLVEDEREAVAGVVTRARDDTMEGVVGQNVEVSDVPTAGEGSLDDIVEAIIRWVK